MDKTGVLIVDDSVLMRSIITSLFEQDDRFYIVGVATNGFECLERIVELQPDLVIMDVEMPEMDGLDALQYIVHYHPMPVVMLSSYTSEGSEQTFKALQIGAVDFFHKDRLFEGNPHMVDDFLLRCKVAARSRMPVLMDVKVTNKNTTINVLKETLTYCLKIEEQLRIAQEELWKTIRQQGGMVVKFKQIKGEFVHTMCEGELLRRFGLVPDMVFGKSLIDFFSEDIAEHHEEHYAKAWSGEEFVLYETNMRGAVYFTILRPIQVDGMVSEVIGVTIDITEQSKAAESLDFLVRHDSLTGLPNRNYLTDLLKKLTAPGAGKPFALFFLNLDNFKILNETLSHELGSYLLEIVARRLKSLARGVHTLARVGGDEFVYLLPNCTPQQVAEMAIAILETIRHPIQIQGHNLKITASMGISRYPEDASDPEALVKYADFATDIAKENGRDQFHFYTAALHERLDQRLKIEKHLRKALERNEFELFFQAIVDTRTDRIVGMESLIRWNSPDLGRVPPNQFIPIAEETNLILDIGEWVLWEACRWNKTWQKQGLPPVTVTVNLSSRQFYDHKLKETIVRILEISGLTKDSLEIEITESMTMDVGRAISTLKELKQLGLQIAMDDFGTGYSSLAYLKEFPIDKLKIDQSFVKGIETNPINASIVNTIISMARNMRMKVIAEGVETEEAQRILKEYDCHYMQGYYFSRPLCGEEAAQLMSIRNID
ncbi:EAL domain-containing protein [Paenibacillus cremeus]|uniref:EAL domain-containing protein n=1 Tax=Paenibacillus cremeus TaxID=2163881 RepID=A0A559KD30_9BACL|nr:EAL domain-containing protein [Paenibacillus cremeus]TVY10046.1 EAL domain-containing protein [Paenibacillus cremeus]